MSIVFGKTFKSGDSQAISLPKEVAFAEEVELAIVRSGDVLTIYPVRTSVKEMVAKLRAMSALVPTQSRDTSEIPEPPGL